MELMLKSCDELKQDEEQSEARRSRHEGDDEGVRIRRLTPDPRGHNL
jgi:hypothetical protein